MEKQSSVIISELTKELVAETDDKFKALFRLTMLHLQKRHKWVAARTRQIRELERIQKAMVASFDRGEFDEHEITKFANEIAAIANAGTKE